MKKTIEEYYNKHEGYIVNKANYYYRLYNGQIQYQEILSEIYLVFCECYEKYNPEVGEFITYFYSCLESSIARKINNLYYNKYMNEVYISDIKVQYNNESKKENSFVEKRRGSQYG